MDRRKFLIGTGSLAAGSAAAIGTGAFSTVSADRTVSVKVADDSAAYLTLRKDGNENAEYADGSGTQMTVNLDASDSNPSGNGVNQDALTTIYDIFAIQNQGAQEALVYVPGSSLSDDGAFSKSDDGVYLDPQVSGMPNGRTDKVLGTLADGTLYTSLTGIGVDDSFEEDVLESNTQVPAGPAVYLLRPGEQFDFGLYIDTDDSATGSFSFDMDIKANADLAQEARNQGVMTVSQNM